MKKIIDEEEIAATVEALPTDLSDEDIKEAVSRKLFPRDILVYRLKYVPDGNKKRRAVEGVCSACGETSILEYVKNDASCRHGYSSAPYGFIEPITGEVKISGYTCICPACGKGVEAVHAAGYKIKQIDVHTVAKVYNVRGHLCVLSWNIQKLMDKQTGQVAYHVDMWEGVVVVGGVLTRVMGYLRFMVGITYLTQWEAKKTRISGLMDFLKCEVLPFDKGLVDATDSANCSLWEYFKSSEKTVYPGEYLQTWCKFPNVENLARQGYGQALTEVIKRSVSTDGYYYAKYHFYVTQVKFYLNVKEAKPHRIIGLEKDEMRILKKYGLDATVAYKKVKEKRGIRLDERALDFIYSAGTGNVSCYVYDAERTNDKEKLMANMPVLRTLHYIEKQREQSGRTAVSAMYYQDYLYMLREIIGKKKYGELKADELYPKDLIRAHDDVTKRYGEKKNQKLLDDFKAVCAKYAGMAYVDEKAGLLIRCAATPGELTYEGAKLSHCVGGYAKDMAAGKTTIFFIRHIETPDEPFCTLEYRNGRVIQNRSFENHDPPPEVTEFQKKWLEYLQTLNKKETKNGRKQTAGVGA